jgi:hypothetical protein
MQSTLRSPAKIIDVENMTVDEIVKALTFAIMNNRSSIDRIAFYKEAMKYCKKHKNTYASQRIFEELLICEFDKISSDDFREAVNMCLSFFKFNDDMRQAFLSKVYSETLDYKRPDLTSILTDEFKFYHFYYN